MRKEIAQQFYIDRKSVQTAGTPALERPTPGKILSRFISYLNCQGKETITFYTKTSERVQSYDKMWN